MENIMLDATLQHIKIVDFGLSHSWRPGAVLETHCGSPEYAAPELFDAAAGYGPEVDLWSIGVVLFGMATGRLPFTLPTSRLMSSAQRRENLLVQVQRGFHSSQERLLMHMPHEFRNAVRLLLEPKVTERLTVEGLRCHPWITCRQSRMIPDRAYKPLGYQEQNKVITQISRLLREDPAKVASEIDGNCLGKAGGMFNIMFHQRSMSGCIEDRLISDEVQKVKSKLTAAATPAARVTTPMPQARCVQTAHPVPSRVSSREPLSFRTKAEEMNSRSHLANIQARYAAFSGRRPATTLSPYEGTYASACTSRRPETTLSPYEGTYASVCTSRRPETTLSPYEGTYASVCTSRERPETTLSPYEGTYASVCTSGARPDTTLSPRAKVSIVTERCTRKGVIVLGAGTREKGLVGDGCLRQAKTPDERRKGATSVPNSALFKFDRLFPKSSRFQGGKVSWIQGRRVEKPVRVNRAARLLRKKSRHLI